MSWCDKLVTTPSIGFRFDYHFVGGDVLLQHLSPILDPLASGEKLHFDMQQQDSFGVTFITRDGYQYGFNPSKAHVTFQHRLKMKAVSGSLPVMEMLSQAKPYTTLLSDVSDRLIRATMLLPSPSTRKMNKIGIVTTAKVSVEDLPPGISKFINYIGRPWKEAPEFYNFNITTNLSSTAKFSDRCVHMLTKAEADDDQMIVLNFDWQRRFPNGRPINKDILSEEVAEARKSALNYFEVIAEGSQFDEEIIRSAT